MRNCSLSRPLDVIACALCDEEGLGASNVSVVIEAFFDGVVENGTGGDFGCFIVLAEEKGIVSGRERGKGDVRLFKVPLRARPATMMLCAEGRGTYIFS